LTVTLSVYHLQLGHCCVCTSDEVIGIQGCYFRFHHYQGQQPNPKLSSDPNPKFLTLAVIDLGWRLGMVKWRPSTLTGTGWIDWV